ncbi:hypothetical protein GTQ99_01380 [Kineococcus sp. T13]|uniref:hypothetical protein n=1 Tax=Kineococcus vitellinus TaxID=2696565 RepID=UPI0014130C22|nr:hypothetical protein [Kineococcus vitellinus]NAZ74083.1 hypothetical protein [Kineococcus vitellinus]
MQEPHERDVVKQRPIEKERPIEVDRPGDTADGASHLDEAPPQRLHRELVTDTAPARLVTSGLATGALALGVLAAVAGVEAVRVPALIAYCVAGIGFAPWNLRADLGLHVRVVLAGLTGIAVGTIVPMVMMALGTWRPLEAFALVGAVSGVLHCLALLRAWSDLRLSRAGTSPPRHSAIPRPLRSHLASKAQLPVALAAAGTLLCLAAAAAHRGTSTPPFWGFPADIGPAWYAGVALILAGFVLAAARDQWSIAVPVVLLAIVTVATPAIVYDGPRSQSAAKHVDLVEQIRLYHELRSSVAVYNAWPGFFAANAWWSEVASLRNPMNLATAWPLVLVGLRVAALRLVAGQLLKSPRTIWTAVLLAVLADPLGADYYSPQSVGFVLGLIVYGLALHRGRDLPVLPLILLAGCLITVSHQLSPFVIGGTLAVLVVFRQIRPWWVPGLVLLPAVLWALLHRAELSPFLSFGALGDPENFRPPQTVGSEQLSRLPVVPATVVALLLCVGVTGLLALRTLVRTRRSLQSWSLAAAPAVGLVLVAANPYGQEGIFRAVLFGMPWLAVLAAPSLVQPAGRWSARVRHTALVTAVVGVLTTAFLVAAFGLDRLTVIRPSDLAVLQQFQQTQRGASGAQTVVVFLGTGNLPTSAPELGWNGVVLGQQDLDLAPRQLPPEEVAGQARTLTDALTRRLPSTATDVFAVWSPTVQDYSWAYGVQSPEQFTALRDGLMELPEWSVEVSRDGTYLFRLDRSGSAVGVAVP